LLQDLWHLLNLWQLVPFLLEVSVVLLLVLLVLLLLALLEQLHLVVLLELHHLTDHGQQQRKVSANKINAKASINNKVNANKINAKANINNKVSAKASINNKVNTNKANASIPALIRRHQCLLHQERAMDGKQKHGVTVKN
jgi:hypothetical protein